MYNIDPTFPSVIMDLAILYYSTWKFDEKKTEKVDNWKWENKKELAVYIQVEDFSLKSYFTFYAITKHGIYSWIVRCYFTRRERYTLWEIRGLLCRRINLSLYLSRNANNEHWSISISHWFIRNHNDQRDRILHYISIHSKIKYSGTDTEVKERINIFSVISIFIRKVAFH